MPVKKGTKGKIVYFSPAEWAEVERRSKALHMRTGSYIRLISVQGEIKKYDNAALNKVSVEISKIGTNINQIVHLANSVHSVNAKDFQKLKAWMDVLKEKSEEWFKPLLYNLDYLDRYEDEKNADSR
ncbi:MAG: plasmid mobilization relaxosome protein MobC [Treponema sp.]|nr:plasmid mobilization relaxosome protein MobC [Treponema sp.]